jgi:hypothetical protein
MTKKRQFSVLFGYFPKIARKPIKNGLKRGQ